MEEYAYTVRLEASLLIRRIFQREPDREMDPLLELITCLLEDGAGGVSPPPGAMATTEQWLTWNHLALNGPDALSRTLTKELLKERSPLPTELEALKSWAARILVATLDRLGMA